MTLENYWLAVPLIGIAVSGIGWLALWLTRHHDRSRPYPRPR